MRILVFGGRGQLGWDITERLKREGFQVVSYGREEVDVRNFDVVRREIKRGWDIVFNCTGYNAVDMAEEDTLNAFAVNMFAPQVMADECRKIGVFFVHVSTDYVFDGKKGQPYVEEDPPSPQSAYALSKLGGELAVRRFGGKWMVVRSGGLYGIWGSKFSGRAYRSFAERVIEACEIGRRMFVVKDRFSAPTWTGDLARKMIEVAKDTLEGKKESGIWHMMQKGVISWYDFAVLVARKKGFDEETIKNFIVPTTSDKFVQKAQRPAFSVLRNGKLEKLGENDMLTVEEAVERYFEVRHEFERKSNS